MADRKKKDISMEPVNIYEVHMQTFKTGKDGEQLSYRTFAKRLRPMQRV